MSIEIRTLEVDGIEMREDDDGHHLVGTVVPWHSTYEMRPGVFERFTRGAFDKTLLERADKIPLLEQHARDRFQIGRSVSFTKTPDGLVADFRLARTARGEEARALAADGLVTGLSVGFRPIRDRESRRDAGGRLVERLEVALDHVGLVSSPAYADAVVTSVRAFDPDDPDVAPRLARARHLLDIG